MNKRLTGYAAIRYCAALGGSVAPRKYADPIEPERLCAGIEDALSIARDDQSLIYFDADTAHPDHTAIMDSIAESP